MKQCFKNIIIILVQNTKFIDLFNLKIFTEDQHFFKSVLKIRLKKKSSGFHTVDGISAGL